MQHESIFVQSKQIKIYSCEENLFISLHTQFRFIPLWLLIYLGKWPTYVTLESVDKIEKVDGLFLM